MSQPEFDIAIVGGGLVGASLAVTLQPLGLKVAVVEAFPLGSEQQPSYDDRSTALSNGSRRIFTGIGVWPYLAHHACPIKTIHVSDKGRFGITRIRHQEEGVDALGYVVTNRHMGEALYRVLDQRTSLISPIKVKAVQAAGNFATLDFETPTDQGWSGIKAKLLVAADGARSVVREQLGIGASVWDYEQSAVIANVTPDKYHQNVAYERFTETGPLAVLPISTTDGKEQDGNRCTIVLTINTEDQEHVLSLADADFLALLQRRFGYRLGRFKKVGKRTAYPLSLTRTNAATAVRTAVIGNAAHALHPIAGQGFNLGLRDVAALAETIVDHGHEDAGSDAVLNAYAQWRVKDQKQVVRLTDSMVRVFRNPLAPVRTARNLGLLGLDLWPGAKTLFARQAMGLNGKLPRLARGLALR